MAATNEQDSADEIFDCCRVIASYRKGDRIEDPEFGLRDQTFTTKFDVNQLKTDLGSSEPRATAVIAAEPDRFDELIERVTARISNREEA